MLAGILLPCALSMAACATTPVVTTVDRPVPQRLLSPCPRPGDRPDLRDPLSDCLRELVLVTHVGLDADTTPAEGLDSLASVGKVTRRRQLVASRCERLAHVQGDDVCPLFGKHQRVAPALPAGRPGDECNFSFDSSH